MIDTLGVNDTHVRIPEDLYLGWPDHGSHVQGSGYTVKWWGVTKYLPNSASVKLTYFPFQSSGLLKKEFSLPSILFGNNVQLVIDLPGAIDAANSMLANMPGVPQVDLWAGRLYRLDVCYNFQVGELVPWYVKSLQGLEYDYHDTLPYTSQGVQFLNGQNALKMYDKARERQDEHDCAGAIAAKGMLRAEDELRKAYLQKLTGCDAPTLADITLPWTYDVIEHDLKELDLLDRSIGTAVTCFRRLREQYGTWEAIAMVGLMQLKLDYPSVELLAHDAHLHPNSIGRHLQNKFAKNQIPPTFTTYSEPLPPLAIDRLPGGLKEEGSK